MSDQDTTLTMIAALVNGDRWLNADACAAFLGMFSPNGKPNRRAFLERIASRPDFPTPLRVGEIARSWRKSEVDEWAKEQQRANRAA